MNSGRFDVWLLGFRPGTRDVGRKLMDAFQIDEPTARTIFEAVPYRVKENVDREYATQLRDTLARAGAQVQLLAPGSPPPTIPKHLQRSVPRANRPQATSARVPLWRPFASLLVAAVIVVAGLHYDASVFKGTGGGFVTLAHAFAFFLVFRSLYDLACLALGAAPKGVFVVLCALGGLFTAGAVDFAVAGMAVAAEFKGFMDKAESGEGVDEVVLAQRAPDATEASAWLEELSNALGGLTNRQSKHIVGKLYDSGAIMVEVGRINKHSRARHMYVHVPPNGKTLLNVNKAIEAHMRDAPARVEITGGSQYILMNYPD